MNLHHGNTKLQNKFQFATSTRRFRADEIFFVSETKLFSIDLRYNNYFRHRWMCYFVKVGFVVLVCFFGRRRDPFEIGWISVISSNRKCLLD